MTNIPLGLIDGLLTRIKDAVVEAVQTEARLPDDKVQKLNTDVWQQNRCLLKQASDGLAKVAKTAFGGVNAYYKAKEETTPGNAARTVLHEFASVIDSVERASTSAQVSVSGEHRPVVEIQGLPNSSEDEEKIIPDWTTLLGTGNTGTCVYAGKWYGNDVAVKVVFKLGDNKQVKREIDALTQLGYHENVLQYYYCQEEVERYFLAFELCQTTLQKWVKNSSCISPACLSKPSALFQATNGLVYLHENGLIHRDLKPTNILLAVNDFGVTVKLADFGVSKILDGKSGATETCVVGTENWRPPEVLQYIEEQFACSGAQAEENEIKLTCKSDIFPLGLVFYFVLTNGLNNLFGVSSSVIKLNTLNPEYVPMISQIPKEFDEYNEIIQQMILYNAHGRPSAQEVLDFALLQLIKHIDIKDLNLD